MSEGNVITMNPKPHPLAEFRDFPSKPRADTFLIQRVLCDKLTVLASYPGKGKTSAMVSMCAVICGAMEVSGLNVKCPRHVVYISEHPEQVEKIALALVQNGSVDGDILAERFHVVEAVRMRPEEVVKAADHYLDLVQLREHNGVTSGVLPLCVIDTAASTLALENENDNAEWGKAISALKQRFKGIPIVLIAHTSKAHKHGSKPEEMTVRGGSAIEGDANQVVFISEDADDTRYLEIATPKHRFVASVSAIEIAPVLVDVEVVDAWGETETEPVLICLLHPLTVKEREEARERRKVEGQEKVAESVLEGVKTAITRLQKAGKLATGNAIYDATEGLAVRKRNLFYGHLEEFCKAGKLERVVLTADERKRLKDEGITAPPKATDYLRIKKSNKANRPQSAHASGAIEPF